MTCICIMRVVHNTNNNMHTNNNTLKKIYINKYKYTVLTSTLTYYSTYIDLLHVYAQRTLVTNIVI